MTLSPPLPLSNKLYAGLNFQGTNSPRWSLVQRFILLFFTSPNPPLAATTSSWDQSDKCHGLACVCPIDKEGQSRRGVVFARGNQKVWDGWGGGLHQHRNRNRDRNRARKKRGLNEPQYLVQLGSLGSYASCLARRKIFLLSPAARPKNGPSRGRRRTRQGRQRNVRQLHSRLRFAEAPGTTKSPARRVVVARSIRPQSPHGAYQVRHMMRRECVERRVFAQGCLRPYR